MPPILHLMRHGQGFHSTAVSGPEGHLIHDPHLTEHGKEQCLQTRKVFQRHEHTSPLLLLSSPLRRALQTCQITFQEAGDLSSRDQGQDQNPIITTTTTTTIIALPHAEEVSEDPSDTGSPVAELIREFGDQRIDFTNCRTPGWFRHEGEFATDAQTVMERARTLRRWIRAREEREVVLVSHGCFNHFVTGEVDGEGRQTTAWWGEAELRTYTFSEDEDDEEAMVYETKGSLTARGWLKDGERKASTLN